MAMNPALSHKLLPRFLGLSIALHACLLAGISPSQLNAPTLHLGDPAPEIRLFAYAPSPMRYPSRKNEPGSTAADKSDTRGITPAESISGPVTSFSTTDIVPRNTMSTTDAREGLRNQLLGVLRTRLSRYLSYPVLARERGWEGTVLLGMRVEPDGQFDEIRIERSSGYAVLDDSALNSLKRLGNIVEARVWLEGHTLDMQIPVIFRLIEN